MADRPETAGAPDRVLLIDKPAGVTSHDVVARVRRELPRGTRVGHAGTLDPFATGLLLVLTGRATRIQRFAMALPKAYWTRVRFGWTSSTGDPEGELVETGRAPAWAADPTALGDVVALPTGRLRQRPPAFSAVKVGGRRAYALARAGVEVEVPEREVEVQRFERVAPDAFEIECSSGTYVRSLVADLGDAYCLELRRTRIGPFSVEDAGTELPLADVLRLLLPVVELGPEDARRAGHGVAVPDPDGPGRAGEVALFDPAGPIAVAEPREDGLLKPVVGFRG